MAEFSHIDTDGKVRMVDVTDKEQTDRTAVAKGKIIMQSATLEKIVEGRMAKGNVLEAARIAGVMAAKKTSDLIPMCHPLSMTFIQVDFRPDRKSHSIDIEATVRLKGQTGVEMEALTAVATAALTVYDMCKSHDRGMIITDIHLAEKSGGKSGHYIYKESTP
jgi:cyclic pyranopterin phosphate synthase